MTDRLEDLVLDLLEPSRTLDSVQHPNDGSQIDLAGYRTCKNSWCSELILKEIASRTDGYCTACFRDVFDGRTREVEIRSRGQRMVANRNVNRTRVANKGNRWTSKQAEKANHRALKRLRMMFPDLYDVLRAEERARVGLEPWPLEHVVEENTGVSLDDSIDFARVLAALDAAGVDHRE